MAFSAAPGASDPPPPAPAAAATSTASSSALAPPPPPSQTQQPQHPQPDLPKLERLGGGNDNDAAAATHHTFLRPVKRIHDGPDVSRFLVSKAYRDIGLFVLQLNHALCPRRKTTTTTSPSSRETLSPLPPLPTAATTTLFTLQSPKRSDDPPSVQRLQALLARIAGFIDEAPPDPGPRRFGNVSFRTWHKLLEERVTKNGLLEEYVTIGRRSSQPTKGDGQDDGAAEEPPAQAMDEVKTYLLGSFGSAQRLDYGTGHELSFLAFLGCLWKLGVFADGDAGADGEAVERSIALGVIEPYLHVVRRLILTYTLEPAGTHGVWGLDDHSFLPYIFGSAQLTRPITAGTSGTPAEAMPQEGSAPRVPKPSDIVKPATVETQRQLNLYFSAVGFINDVKRGPFWEHSPILYDVSGIKDGWGKINKGMIKMFNAEVLSKFPVVQHFVFGSLFSWDEDPQAAAPVPTMHMTNQPLAAAATAAALKGSGGGLSSIRGGGGSSAAGATGATGATGASAAPVATWAQATRMPGAGAGSLPGPGIPYSRVPPAAPTRSTMGHPATSSVPPAPAPPTVPLPLGDNRAPGEGGGPAATGQNNVVTRAPWAK